MELKKSKKVDLERNKGIYLQIGLVVVLSLILIAFEWTSKPDQEDTDRLVADAAFEVEEMIVTRRQEEPPPPPEQRVAEILNIVEDDVDLDDDFDFNVEADSKTEFRFTGFVDDAEEFDEDQVFYIVEQMPTFNGGDPAVEFRKFIATNLRYPEIAAENGISGRVFVQFAVNNRGRIVDAVVISGVDPSLDKEALRVIMSSPPWTPGKQRGKEVKVLFTFPINFVLQ